MDAVAPDCTEQRFAAAWIESVMRLRPLAGAIVTRAALLGFGWWAISEGDYAGVAFGALVVAAATAVSVALSEPFPFRVRPIALTQLAGAFVVGSVRGGVDVAYRSLSRNMRLSPAIIRYRCRLPIGGLQHLFMSMLSLMPGTQAVDVDGEDLQIHVLVLRGETNTRELAALEARIAAAFQGGRR